MVGDNLTLALALLVLAVAPVLLRLVGRRLWRFRRRYLTVRSIRWRLRTWWWASKRAARLSHERLTGALPGVAVSALRVVDGDTFDDPATGARYRLANIDCPETEDRAGCYRERIIGEQAKHAAEIILASAERIELRPTTRIDVYGRTVAHVRIDDRDFGALMIKRGFARRWSGKREKWCGPKGGLVALARAASVEHVCKTCRVGITAQSKATNSVIAFPVVYRKTDKPSDKQPP